jgi:glycosyltransferase involved in cell wall biosynthesis
MKRRDNLKNRVLFVYLGIFRFGIFLYLKNLSEILSQDKIEVYLATSSKELVSLLKKEKKLTVIKLPSISFSRFLFLIKDIFLLIRFLIRDSFLILQTLDRFSLFLSVIFRLNRKIFPLYLETLPLRQTAFFRLFKKYLFKVFFWRVKVVTPLKFLASDLEKAGIKKPLKVGFSFVKLPPLSSPSLNRPPVFGFLGDFTREARVDIFLRACRLLALEGLDFKVALCGIGKEEIYLRRLSRDLEIEARVSFYKNVEEFEKIMLNFWLMVFPNYYQSALASLLFGQAMAIPAVVCRSEPFLEIISNGENGYIVEPENPLAFRKAMLDLLPKNKRDKFGLNARKFFIENYQSRFLARSILAFYEEFFDSSGTD